MLSGAFVLSSWLTVHAQDRTISRIAQAEEPGCSGDNKRCGRPASISQSDVKALIKGVVSDEKGKYACPVQRCP